MFKLLHEDVFNVIAVSSCNQICKTLLGLRKPGTNSKKKLIILKINFSRKVPNVSGMCIKSCNFKTSSRISRPEMFLKNMPLKDVLKKFRKFYRKTHVRESFFCNNRPAILQKKRLRHSCFPLNFAKCLRTPFYRTLPEDCF